MISTEKSTQEKQYFEFSKECVLLEANQKHEKAQNEAVFKSENQQKTAFPPPNFNALQTNPFVSKILFTI